jgi:selenide, water dikinase
LPSFIDPNLIIGREVGDDAAVYALGPDQAVVFTVDCLTPIHDDPFTFGQIVAANCLSDVWAMGGRPLLAINVCGFPQYDLPLEVLSDILRGGAAKAAEAGVPVAGGHTMNNAEPFYGMAVVGLAHPGKLITNAGARPGDRLVLTKPLGTGIVVTAVMKDKASDEVAAAVATSMSALNRDASEVMVRHGARAATDVTGFGLVGHAHTIAKESGVELRLHWDALPILPGALEFAAQGTVTGGGDNNRQHYSHWIDFGPRSEAQIEVVCDPQTSGGLLIALPAEALAGALQEMGERGVQAVHVGEVVTGKPGRVVFS